VRGAISDGRPYRDSSPLEESSLGTGERTLEIDRLKPVGPIFDCCTVRLGALLVRTQDSLAGIGWVKLELPFPSSVSSLFNANPHDVSSITVDDLGGVFADKHGVGPHEIRCRVET